MPDPLNHPMTAEPLEVPITADPEGFVAATLSAYESDPDWSDPQGLVWIANFDPRVCPVCLALDGSRYWIGNPDLHFDGRNKISPHAECRCYLVPWKWRNELMVRPDGVAVPANRGAVGDNGEETISYLVTAEQWLRANPLTAERILGHEIAAAFLGQCSNGLPLPPIPLEWAAERWNKQRENLLQPMLDYEERLAKARQLYRERKDPEMLRRAIEAYESCIPLMETALDSFVYYEASRPNASPDDEIGHWGEAFQQLAIIYEKQGRFSDALALWRESMNAGWGGDWLPRMARLEKRLAKKQPEANH